MLLGLLRNWNRRRILRRHRIPDALWRPVLAGERAAGHLTPEQGERLRDLASLFLYEKSIEPARDLPLEESMRVRIACQAALPILNLGLDYYRDWYSVILYPGAYVARDLYRDEAGVVHSRPGVRAGEAWERGPVILSWEDAQSTRPGYNVVIHEMAHKLDLLDGVANGFPPLHRGMQQQAWTDAFSEAFDALLDEVESGHETAVDAYAATDPAEFFAVTSEVFFGDPRLLEQQWPRVYRQLALYYRQQP